MSRKLTKWLGTGCPLIKLDVVSDVVCHQSKYPENNLIGGKIILFGRVCITQWVTAIVPSHLCIDLFVCRDQRLGTNAVTQCDYIPPGYNANSAK